MEIFDFKTYRDTNRFAVGKIWALYDKHDAMPRHYAKIVHSDNHNHKIHLTWLDHDATNKEEEKWTDKKLPVACGSFRLQPTVDTSQDRCMFSHSVPWTKGMKGNSYDIYPRKGEVWALYKGWSMQWSSDTDSLGSYEYEVVEVLSNMSANDGALVIPLVKIKDFVSLFARAKGMSRFLIPSSELLRFSHSIPFYRTDGNEKIDVPRDFLELDTACLPADLDATFSSVTLVSYMFLGNMTGCMFVDLTTESADNKKDNSLADTNSIDDSVCSDNVAGGKNQAAELVPSTLDSQDEGNVTQEGSQQKYKKDVMDLANHMHCNPVITNECSHFFDFRTLKEVNMIAGCVKSSSASRGANVKPNGSSQDSAHIFQAQQRDTPNLQGHRLKPSSVGRGTDMKANGSQDPAHMFRNQQHGVYGQNGQPVKPSAGRDTDAELRMNVAQLDEYMKGKANDPEMLRGKFQFSTLNQDKSSVPMGNGDMQGTLPISDPANPNIVDTQKSVQEDASAILDAIDLPGSAKPSSACGKIDGDASINVACSGLIPDSVDLNITVRRNLHRQDASTMLTGAGSSGTQSSVKRKTYADVNVYLDKDTNKRPMKNNLPSDVNVSCKKVCDDGVTNAGIQSDPPHVSSANVGTQQMPKVANISDHQVNIKEKATETDSDQDNIMEEATETYSDQDNIMEEAPQTVSETKLSYSKQVSFPDPDIFDFKKIRDINVFEVGQIWALYDILDIMPRYYARIKHFDASNFKIHLTWLEYVAMDEDEENWTVEELPTACGNFRLGKGTDITEDKEMFSHIASWTKGKKRNSYVIYPNKGEVWALYMGWSMDWSSDADNHRSYEYEVVEVVSSMSANGGATVIPLVRIEGFVSLFATAKDKSSFVIPLSELLRFSHSIPFYRTEGNEKVGVPRGFLELDNACLPADPDAAFSSVTLDCYMSLSKTESCTSDNVTTENKTCRMDLGDDEIAQKENHPEDHIGGPMSTDNPKDMCPEQNTPLKKTAGDANEFSDFSHQGSLSPNIYTYPDSDFHKSADNKMNYADELIARKEESSLEQNVGNSISADNTDDISSYPDPEFHVLHIPMQKMPHVDNESGDSSQQNCMSSIIYSYPDPEFHDFEEGCSLEKFKHGQIWAIYNNTDKFPNFYAWIRKVDPEPFRVHLTWLEAWPRSDQEKRWLEQGLSISCGTFLVRNWRTEYGISIFFSHLVDARPTEMNWQFEVLPQVGQVWATYMNWAPGWVPTSDAAREYMIGEVIKSTETGTKLTVLTQVGGYRYVFKPDNTKGVLEIPAGENLRFSHRIPSFRLTEEMGGTLRGFYELDPASLPDVFLYRDT